MRADQLLGKSLNDEKEDETESDESDRRGIEQLIDAEVLDVDGERIGQVRDVYLDDRTGQPSWVTVNTGWFGPGKSFVPLDRAQLIVRCV